MDRAEFRQWAMIYAMQGLLANPINTLFSAETLAASAVANADALLEANTIDEPASQNEREGERCQSEK